MINIGKSQGIRKIVSCVLIGGMLIGDGLVAYAGSSFVDESLSFHREFEMRQLQYYESLHDIDMSEFDDRLVDLYRNGTLDINGKSYDINYLVLTYDEDEIHLVYSKDKNVDLLSNEYSENGFHNTNNLLFKDSRIFLDICNLLGFDNNKITIDNNNFEEFLSLFEDYDGEVQREVPETSLKYYKNYKHMRSGGRNGSK